MKFALYVLAHCAKFLATIAALAVAALVFVKLPWVFAAVMTLAGALLVIAFLVEMKTNYDHAEAVKRHRRRRDESN